MIDDVLRGLRRRLASALSGPVGTDAGVMTSAVANTAPLAAGGLEENDGFSQYEMRSPSAQNAIDALPGWASAFPGEAGVTAGNIPLFADSRILAALETFGSIEGKRVLEVGPLEGMHTYLLSRHGAASIDAVEANRLCYLRCLVTKEILGIDRASFHLGDIQHWLQDVEVDYDFAVASGVLYHMPDPGEFLRLISLRASALFIWTHFYDPEAMPVSDVRHRPFTGNVEVRSVAGMDLHYHERGYQLANANASFCGGMKNRHYWLRKEEIVRFLQHLGYDIVTVLDEDPAHTGGPCFSLVAMRTAEN